MLIRIGKILVNPDHIVTAEEVNGDIRVVLTDGSAIVVDDSDIDKFQESIIKCS